MGIWTISASNLDTSISNLLSKLDAYLAQSGQLNEPNDSMERYFITVLLHKLRKRKRLQTLIDTRWTSRPITMGQDSIVLQDPHA
jgi:hypothetical protein